MKQPTGRKTCAEKNPSMDWSPVSDKEETEAQKTG